MNRFRHFRAYAVDTLQLTARRLKHAANIAEVLKKIAESDRSEVGRHLKLKIPPSNIRDW